MPNQNGHEGLDQNSTGHAPVERSAHSPFRARATLPTLGGSAPASPRGSVEARLGGDEPVDSVVAPAHGPRRDWRLLVAVSFAGLLLVAAGWFAYASHENEKSAQGWKQRSIELDEQVNGLRTLIGERSAQLNVRTRQANRLATNLRATRDALERSESDVTSLARRQRELANEKAQLEDQRRALQQQAGALADIASRYISCKSSLIDVINALIDQDYSSASYEIDIANSRCDSAASALNAYVAMYE
jgi:septal ring factor EnvC (AmiA/AmiB activator)